MSLFKATCPLCGCEYWDGIVGMMRMGGHVCPERCGDQLGLWTCTLPKGHEGPHAQSSPVIETGIERSYREWREREKNPPAPVVYATWEYADE